jgi:hypothetical protein
MNITIGADDLIDIPTFPLPTKIRVIIRGKTRHQLLAGSDHSVGVDDSVVAVLGLPIGADMILWVNSSLTISGSKTSEDKSTYGSSAK